MSYPTMSCYYFINNDIAQFFYYEGHIKCLAPKRLDIFLNQLYGGVFRVVGTEY